MTPSRNGGVEGYIFHLFDDFSKSHPEVSYIYIGIKHGGFSILKGLLVVIMTRGKDHFMKLWSTIKTALL